MVSTCCIYSDAEFTLHLPDFFPSFIQSRSSSREGNRISETRHYVIAYNTRNLISEKLVQTELRYDKAVKFNIIITNKLFLSWRSQHLDCMIHQLLLYYAGTAFTVSWGCIYMVLNFSQIAY